MAASYKKLFKLLIDRDVIKECVIPAAEKAGIDYEIYDTKCKGDATNFCREKAEEAKKSTKQIAEWPNDCSSS